MALVRFSQVVALAKSQDGVVESPPYSNRTKYGVWYGWNGVYWCAIFISWLFGRLGASAAIYGKSASVAVFRQRFQAHGRYGRTPKVGALAIFPGDEHIELVLAVFGTYLVTIGGNTSAGAYGSQYNGGQVALKTRGRNSIAGYCYPQYAAAAPTPAKPAPVSNMARLKRLQSLMRLAPNGVWGTTVDATAIRQRTAARYFASTLHIRAVFNVRMVQNTIKAKVDGDFGPDSKAKLKNWVTKVQSILGEATDGDWGVKTDRAFLAFRAANRR